jgi:hypothetical protein
MVERLEENLGIARAAKLHALPLEVAAELAMGWLEASVRSIIDSLQ